MTANKLWLHLTVLQLYFLLSFGEKMLHGKHVMVRVGGGWDTLQGFLLKYDPCRILQFATLEQKILAFQKVYLPFAILSGFPFWAAAFVSK